MNLKKKSWFIDSMQDRVYLPVTDQVKMIVEGVGQSMVVLDGLVQSPSIILLSVEDLLHEVALAPVRRLYLAETSCFHFRYSFLMQVTQKKNVWTTNWELAIPNSKLVVISCLLHHSCLCSAYSVVPSCAVKEKKYMINHVQSIVCKC